jgi:transposase-like protein
MPRGKKPYFTPEQDAEVARRYETGETLQRIADSFGISEVPVMAALGRQQVRRRSTSDYAWQDTPENRAEITRLWRDDASVKNIARTVHTRDVNVSRVLREAGIEARFGGQHHRFSNQQVVALVKEWRAGDSLATLANRHGGNPVTVRNALLRAGVDTNRRRPKYWTPERIQWVRGQYESGRSMADIGKEIGYSAATISVRLRPFYPRPQARGENHHSWKGGRTKNADGYTLVTPTPEESLLCPPMANGYVLENRLVMARALGRPLLKTETVHHIDGDHANAALGNLQLRQGNHGSGVILRCRTCGSHDVVAVPIADPATEEVTEQ